MRERWLFFSTLLCLTAQQSTSLNFTLLADTIKGIQKLARAADEVTHDIKYLKPEYDFIVVGAGTGGSTVTNRLTEVPEWSVLLIEAGGEESFVSDLPAIHAHMQLTDHSWGYTALPQDNACLGLKGRRCRYPQGKGMGGSSVINAMIYTRGHKRDYDEWVNLGNPGWGWDEVLPYFKKSERARGEFAVPDYHGSDGYLGVEYSPYHSPLLNAFLDSADEIGYPRVDYNSGNEIGFSIMQANLLNGTRCSANKAFLRPIRNRKNLSVAKNAQVTKILIDPTSRRAYGVEYYRNGKFKTVRARKEVILSAGAINTPKIMMHSGIGPQDHLKKFDIPVIIDAPGVGSNMMDHVTMSGLAFLVNQSIGVLENRLVVDIPSYLNFLAYHEGPFSTLGGIEGIAFVRTPVAKTPPDYPDVELIFASASIAADDGRVVRTGIGITDTIYNTVYKPINNKDAWTIWPMITRQESRGWVRLKSKNPLLWPIMYGNYFDEEHDLVTLVEGIKFAVELSKTKSFQQYGSKLHDIPLPACKNHQFASDPYWACVARQLTSSLHHFCGTAKMGPRSDPWAVVDPELRVYGILGLRVVDASVIPLIPAAHTNAPTYMIGEKAADIIKEAYGKL